MASDPHRLAAVLARIDDWSVPEAGAALFDRSGIVALHGTSDTVIPVASLTKLATAWALHVAVEEGTLSLEEPAGPTGSTVRHLLCHASGLPFEGRDPITAPGRRRIYSNSGYEMLAEHLQRASGIAFEAYLQEAVLDPLAMDSATLHGSAAAGLHATLSDVVLLGLELLSPKLIAESTWAEATAVSLPQLSGVLPGWGQQNPCPWGLGPEIRGTKSPHWTGADADAATFGHFGGAGSFLWVDAGAGFGCAFTGTRPFGDWAVAVWPTFSDAVRAAYLGS